MGKETSGFNYQNLFFVGSFHFYSIGLYNESLQNDGLGLQSWSPTAGGESSSGYSGSCALAATAAAAAGFEHGAATRWETDSECSELYRRGLKPNSGPIFLCVAAVSYTSNILQQS